jgi:diguanylate cyclase (GGDEF)-like protein
VLFDQSSFMIAIGFAAGALTITTFVAWLGARADTYLLYWAIGLALIVPSTAMLGIYMHPYQPAMNCMAFAILLAGIVLIEAGGAQFRTGKIDLRFSVAAWIVSIGSVSLGFATGYTGIGVLLLNLACGILFCAAGRQFWKARAEAPVAVAAVAGFYVLLGISFLLCMIPILANGEYVLSSRPQNWAEDINSAMIIVTLAGVGALVLAIAQHRATQLHRRNASLDPLTGLLNRRALFDRIGEGMIGGQGAAIMFDLDSFKRINDQFGHATGDEVIVRFADILRDHVRAGDVTARLGGEEFCVLLPATPPDAAHDVAESVRAAFAATPPLGGDYGPPTVSAGFAHGSLQSATFDALLRDADAALYRAKKAGRNRVKGPPPRLVA